MIREPTIIQRLIGRIAGPKYLHNAEHIDNALQYIDEFWPTLTRKHTANQGTLIGLPHPYIVPAARGNSSPFHFEEQYYWDSYFIAVGLAGTKHHHIAEGMLDNLLYLYKQFGMIPTANRMYFTSRSQPPLLTTFIRLIYETSKKDLGWLSARMEIARQEYTRVWMSEDHPLWHQVHQGLSRYYDINVLHDLAEAESGWDMTTRFERMCLDFVPVDLNCLLYRYELDFAWDAKLRGDHKSAAHWKRIASTRQKAIWRIMWHKRKKFFFDYNHVKHELSDTWSLAGYYALWSGVASDEQAAALVAHLSKFEKVGGLTTTSRPLIDMSVFGSQKTQWAYPNGWAPLHWLVIEGLKRYGYDEHARRIATKWLHANLDWFSRHGVFLEKYNVVNPRKRPVEGVYPSQSGFGWTNAIFLKLAQDYLHDRNVQE